MSGHIANEYQNCRERHLAEFGISRSGFNILHQLIIHLRPMHLGEISMRTKVDRALIGRSAKQLVDKGLITIQDNPFHKTKKDAVLTDKGREIATQVRRVTLEWEQEVEKYLTEDERERFFMVLEKVYQASEELS